MTSHPGLANLDDPANYEDDWDDDDRRSDQTDYDDGPDDRCVSCSAEIDHYLGCPDDPDPDYEQEAAMQAMRSPRGGRQSAKPQRRHWRVTGSAAPGAPPGW